MLVRDYLVIDYDVKVRDVEEVDFVAPLEADGQKLLGQVKLRSLCERYKNNLWKCCSSLKPRRHLIRT